MRLKCIFAAGIVCSAIVPSTHAFDTAGKFGMGVRFWETPIITFANMKIGLTNAIGLEPSEGYYRGKMSIHIPIQKQNIPILAKAETACSFSPSSPTSKRSGLTVPTS